MPSFLPTPPPHSHASPSSSDSSGNSAESFASAPDLGCQGASPQLHRKHLQMASSSLGPEAKGLRQTSQGLELSSWIPQPPWQASASGSGHDGSKALCHHTLGASPAKRGKDQARTGAQAGK